MWNLTHPHRLKAEGEVKGSAAVGRSSLMTQVLSYVTERNAESRLSVWFHHHEHDEELVSLSHAQWPVVLTSCMLHVRSLTV